MFWTLTEAEAPFLGAAKAAADPIMARNAAANFMVFFFVFAGKVYFAI